ncbi:MAG: single-stranded DNA-binding protein [Myxococcota bacterium]
MSDLNSISVTGRVGNDPELRGSGEQVRLGLRIAVSDRVKKGGEWTKETTWLSVTLWGKRAESLSRLVRKGSRIGVGGKLHIREYEHNGEKRKDVEIVRADVALLDPPPDSRTKPRPNSGGDFGKGAYDDFPADDFGDDQVPF